MGKVSCKIGFGINEEVETDIFDDRIIEKPYTGDLLKNHQSYDQADTLSGDVRITNQISIMGNDFLFKNLTNIRYILYKNQRWIITVEEAYPRIIVNMGGIYNGPTPENV